MAPPINRSAGFALVELLASLVILGMISMLIVSGVGSGRRVWETLDAGAASGEGISSAQTILRERVERAFPATGFDAETPYTQFRGEIGSIQFLAPPVAARAPDALRRFKLSLTPAGDLILTSTSDLAADAQHPVVETLVLVHGVQGVDIAYFGAASPDGEGRWRESWDEQPTPPQLVRIRLAFAAGDRRQWPDLLIHPAATVDAQCILDTASGRCRGRAA